MPRPEPPARTHATPRRKGSAVRQSAERLAGSGRPRASRNPRNPRGITHLAEASMAAGVEVAGANPATAMARLGWSACGGRDQEGMEDWRKGVQS